MFVFFFSFLFFGGIIAVFGALLRVFLYLLFVFGALLLCFGVAGFCTLFFFVVKIGKNGLGKRVGIGVPLGRIPPSDDPF